MKLKISSRQSALAQAQSYLVASVLKAQHSSAEIEFLFRESLGDKNLTDPLWKMPEKGVFTEDFFQDLVLHKTDMVVHSWKDLPTDLKPETQIVATLPRADQRDLLLFKKSSLQKKNPVIYSSSPRRIHNIAPFLRWALPWQTENIEFMNVRGNIPTRIQKMLDAESVDGLVLAKAALDRLLVDQHFPDTVEFIKKSLELCQWMVLPLTENPNAAAQGALAIEIASDRTDILDVVKQINCTESFASAHREREILKEFGGGCHLALGMSVLERSYGRIEIVKGKSPDGSLVSSQKFFPKKKIPSSLKIGRLEFSQKRQTQTASVENFDAVYVARAEAYVATSKQMLVWSAGLQTWRKLAAKGVWVSGSSEGLGESEDMRISVLTGPHLKWARLSHDLAEGSEDKDLIGSYSLELELKTTQADLYDAYVWKSGYEFLLAVQSFPQINKCFHICGPGRTYDTIKKHLGSDEKIFVELSDEFITVV